MTPCSFLLVYLILMTLVTRAPPFSYNILYGCVREIVVKVSLLCLKRKAEDAGGLTPGKDDNAAIRVWQ